MRPLIISLLIFCSLSAPAQVVLENVEACLQYAEQNNPELAAARHQASAAAVAKQMQRASLFPQIKAVSSLDYYFSLPVQLIPAEIFGGEPGTFQAVSFGQEYNLNVGLEASMPLINASLWLGNRQAVVQARTGALQLQQAQLTTADAVAKAYYLTLLSQEAVRLAQVTKAANDSLLQLVQHKLENGVAEPLEANRIRNLQLESARNLEENSAIYTNNLNRLKLVLGLESQEQLELREQLAQEEQLSTLSPAFAPTTLPAYKLNEARLEGNRLAWQRERSKRLPSLSAWGRYTRQAQHDALAFTAPDQRWFTIGVVGLRLEWSLFTGLYQLSASRQARLQYEAAELELQHTAHKLEQEQLELQTNFQLSKESLRYTREAYALGTQNYQLARIKYEAGVYSLDQLINVYHEKIRAQNSLLKVTADFLFYSAIITSRNTL